MRRVDLPGGEPSPVKKAFVIIAVFFACTVGSGAQNLYGEDLVRRLASPAEIREVTNIRSRLRKESKEAEPLFVLSPLPFGDIPTAPDVSPSQPTQRPKQWYLPPWPSLDPALPPDMPESIRKEYEARSLQTVVTPEIWPDLITPQREVASALLVPKRVAPGEEFVFRIKDMPEAFSVRRYYESDKNIFIELAAFGGTTPFKAEEAYRAMKEVAVQQEPMQGFGEEAFLTRVLVVDESTIPPETSPLDGPPLPEVPPFPEVEPEDKARPELLDSGRAAALTAPAFRTVAVADLEGKTVTYPSPPKKYFPKGGKVRHSLLVLVAFFPDESLTLSFAIEERMGTVQDLMALAMLAQRKLRDDVVARD
jgi:hypothetical protein